MDVVKIMLACGTGQSSGFMASRMRRAAKKLEVSAEINARSDAEIDENLDRIHVLLLGPHLKYMEEEVKERAKSSNVVVAVIPQDVYGALDGEKAVEIAIGLLNQGGI